MGTARGSRLLPGGIWGPLCGNRRIWATRLALAGEDHLHKKQSRKWSPQRTLGTCSQGWIGKVLDKAKPWKLRPVLVWGKAECPLPCARPRDPHALGPGLQKPPSPQQRQTLKVVCKAVCSLGHRIAASHLLTPPVGGSTPPRVSPLTP